MFGCILAVFLGSTPAVAQSSVTPTKPLTTPGLNQPLLVPPANTSKNPSGVTGLGPGPGGSIPGFSSVINPQPSTGGRDAESVPSAETRTPTRQRLWNPSNFRMNVDGFEKAATKPTKVDALKVKQSTKSDELGAARDYAKPPAKAKKSEGAAAKFDNKAKPRSTEFELMFDGWDTSKSGPTPKMGPLDSGFRAGPQDKSKYGTWGSGFTPDKSSKDGTKYGTWGSGYTPDKSSNEKSKYGTWGSGFTNDKSSKDGQYGTWGTGFNAGKSSKDETKYGTWGSTFTNAESSNDGSTSGESQTEKQNEKDQSSR
jgi:hypothetical protein